MKKLFALLLTISAMHAASPRVRSLQPHRRHIAVSYEQAVSQNLPIVAALGSGKVLAISGGGEAGEIIEPASKVSDALEHTADLLYVVVVFHADVPSAEIDRILQESRVQNIERSDLLPAHRLVRANPDRIRTIADWDEVSRIFPASKDLISGSPVAGCVGPVTEVGPIANYVATVGNGWDGAGRGSAELTFSIANLTQRIPAELVHETIERVLAEWSRHANIRFTRANYGAGSRNLNFSFDAREHGDPYPFDGPGGVLGHTFYPAGINPEPIAGDLHLDDEENWSIGGYTDLYSVLLHEVGHALGLGHADRSEAVMYPYYKRSTTLHAEDIAALRVLYDYTEPEDRTVVTPAVPAQPSTPSLPSTPPPPSTPTPSPSTPPEATPPSSQDVTKPQLAVTSPALTVVSTSASSIVIRGTARDSGGIREVSWSSGSTSGVASGTVAWNFQLPLLTGDNTVVVTAIDNAGNKSWRSLSVTRR